MLCFCKMDTDLISATRFQSHLEQTGIRPLFAHHKVCYGQFTFIRPIGRVSIQIVVCGQVRANGSVLFRPSSRDNCDILSLGFTIRELIANSLRHVDRFGKDQEPRDTAIESMDTIGLVACFRSLQVCADQRNQRSRLAMRGW